MYLPRDRNTLKVRSQTEYRSGAQSIALRVASRDAQLAADDPHSIQFSQSNALRSGHTSLSRLAVNRIFVAKYSRPAGKFRQCIRRISIMPASESQFCLKVFVPETNFVQ
jgi:hypothetical protein